MLDVDDKIITELVQEGRISYSDLSERLSLNPTTVSKKVNQLIQNGVINIIGQPNPYALGLSASALIAIKADPSKVDDIYNKLSEIFNVFMFLTVFGRFDIFIGVYFTNWDELHKFISQTLSNIDGITQVEPFFIKERKKGYPPFFNEDYNQYAKFTPSEFDWKLIEALVINGRLTLNDLSKKLGAHQSTVSRRINFFIEKNILPIRALVDVEYTGLNANAYIAVEADHSQIENICSILSSFPEIHLIMTLINGYSIIIGIHAVNNKILYSFINNNLACIKGLHSTETFIRAEIKKRYYGGLHRWLK